MFIPSKEYYNPCPLGTNGIDHFVSNTRSWDWKLNHSLCALEKSSYPITQLKKKRKKGYYNPLRKGRTLIRLYFYLVRENLTLGWGGAVGFGMG